MTAYAGRITAIHSVAALALVLLLVPSAGGCATPARAQDPADGAGTASCPQWIFSTVDERVCSRGPDIATEHDGNFDSCVLPAGWEPIGALAGGTIILRQCAR